MIIFPSLPKVPQTFIIIKNPLPSLPLPSPPPLPEEKNSPRVPQAFVINFSTPTKKEKRKKSPDKDTPNGHHHGWSRSTLTCLSSDGRTTYRSEPPAAGKTKNKWKINKWKMNK
jgi:hypothetical protein